MPTRQMKWKMFFLVEEQVTKYCNIRGKILFKECCFVHFFSKNPKRFLVIDHEQEKILN